ncbi:MAG: hypothetical protein IPI00_07645 [Flavobacteriales bacterium]|nr:hypothetical protein [Flavobacteriales bacterium]MBK6943829.1 hypothetical protein [Flavobacteriales bacterium]MBK7240039.1 hypothetical protein [Flavobacteriales bacterium]MBK9535639.1 hypothetical protein [Flavobacteriales bacterium]MBP9138657.1 hypothetical protein [Flavobacteriales bacterium]
MNTPHTRLEDRSGAATLTFPIARTFNANVQLDLTSDSWKELLLSGVRVRASQVMGSLKYGYREISITDNTVGLQPDPRSLHTASAGLLGISLTKKFRILFWNVNVNISEENETLNDPAIRFSGLIGKMKVKGLHRQFYYGLVLVHSDGLTLPLPFIGGQTRLAKKLYFNYTLPVQIAILYRPNAGTLFQAGVGVDAWRSGVSSAPYVQDQRTNLNYQAVRGFINGRTKLNRTFVLRGEVGYAFHDLRWTVPQGEVVRTTIEPGITATIGLNILFGQSVVEQILNDVLH